MDPISSISSAALPRLPDSAIQRTAPTPGFGQMLMDNLQGVSNAEHLADNLTEQLAAGGPVDVHQVTIATTKAALATELIVAVRDKAIEAYQQIMALQL